MQNTFIIQIVITASAVRTARRSRGRRRGGATLLLFTQIAQLTRIWQRLCCYRRRDQRTQTADSVQSDTEALTFALTLPLTSTATATTTATTAATLTARAKKTFLSSPVRPYFVWQSGSRYCHIFELFEIKIYLHVHICIYVCTFIYVYAFQYIS